MSLDPLGPRWSSLGLRGQPWNTLAFLGFSWRSLDDAGFPWNTLETYEKEFPQTPVKRGLLLLCLFGYHCNFLDFVGTARISLDFCGYTWRTWLLFSLDNVGPSWTVLDVLGLSWTTSDNPGSSCKSLDPNPSCPLRPIVPAWMIVAQGRNPLINLAHLANTSAFLLAIVGLGRSVVRVPPSHCPSCVSFQYYPLLQSTSCRFPLPLSLPCMALQLHHLRDAYLALTNRVNIALRTQVGDAARLREIRAQALALRSAGDRVRPLHSLRPPCLTRVIQHRNLFPIDEYRTLQTSIERMVTDLDAACHQSVDPPEAPPLPIVQDAKTGHRGRPSKLIDRTFLQYALDMRGPAHVAKLLLCSPRTVRRAALRYGLVEPGPPVLRTVVHQDGSTTRIHSSSTPPVSRLDNAALDAQVRDILEAFPHFGRVMIAGTLASRGHRVPDSRIRESFLRVRGAPPVFGRRRIVRKKYHVPGPNSLWHHDGQHGKSRRPTTPVLG